MLRVMMITPEVSRSTGLQVYTLDDRINLDVRKFGSLHVGCDDYTFGSWRFTYCVG